MKNIKKYPIFLAFLAMGFGDAIGPFVGLAKEQFSLNNFQAQFIAFSGFIMFGLLSIPLGIFQDKHGKKRVLMIGLFIALSGLVIPLFGLKSYELFLLTTLLLGAGAATLQVAGNPIMRDVSLPGKYSRNLSFGQFIKAIGSLSGSLIPFAAAKWFGAEWKILFPIYVSTIIITIILIALTKIEEQQENKTIATFKSCFSLLKNRLVFLMVAGIFIYVGIEICISTGVPILLNSQYGIDLKTWGLLGNAFFFISIIIGRFFGAVILNWIKPKLFLKITSLVSVFGLGLIFTNIQTVVILGIFIVGLGFANIFPLIFSITVDYMPERSNEISGLMVTAIVGGAFIPLIMGALADKVNILAGFYIPAIGLTYLIYIAFFLNRVTKPKLN